MAGRIVPATPTAIINPASTQNTAVIDVPIVDKVH
jgi:hypothetical protein